MSEAERYKYKDLTDKIINLSIKVHKKLGPGFVEKIYQRALYIEFKNNKINFNREKKINVMYEDVDLGYEIVDFEVEGKVLLELKAVSEINEIHLAQLLSYLKAANKEVGLILNFARPTLEIKRVASSVTTEAQK